MAQKIAGMRERERESDMRWSVGRLVIVIVLAWIDWCTVLGQDFAPSGFVMMTELFIHSSASLPRILRRMRCPGFQGCCLGQQLRESERFFLINHRNVAT